MTVAFFCAGAPVRAQSLAEAARKESERRRQLAEQGVEAKVIEGDGRGPAPQGTAVTFTPGTGRENVSAQAKESRSRTPASAYRNLLQKLDREISECEERRRRTLQQAEAEKWSPSKVLRSGRSQGGPNLQERLKKQAEDLEVKLKRLRRQRSETYEAGRKAGYLPGELDGKAVAP